MCSKLVTAHQHPLLRNKLITALCTDCKVVIVTFNESAVVASLNAQILNASKFLSLNKMVSNGAHEDFQMQ